MEALQTLSRNGDRAYQKAYGHIFPGENNVPKHGLVVSEEEYWEKYYDDPDFVYEWNNGRLEARPMSDVKGSKAHRWFCNILDCYLTTYPVATAVSLEIGFRLVLPAKITDRIPDLAVVRNDNPTPINDDDRSYDGTFDLCIESLSHSSSEQIKRDVKDKKAEYESAGVKEYYILDARGTETAFYRLGRRGIFEHIRPAGEGVIVSRVLPDFQFRISDLYTRPPLEELARDGVYQDYVFPSYKEVIQRAEQAELRAEQAERQAEREAELRKQEAARAEQAERQAEREAELRKQEAARAERERLRAEQEAARAERLAEKLRAMGIDPNVVGES
ncbi:Uma2 family endonuclease [Desulfococcaceae bacterium HSG8]|nr:Uma2 family endonuclease [Desulfococcaceae bacterium HSG8]